MSDIGEIFGCIREVQKERKKERLEDFAKSGLQEFFVKHTDYHYSTVLQQARLDYWPSTHKWRWKDKNYWGTLANFCNFLKKRGWNGRA